MIPNPKIEITPKIYALLMRANITDSTVALDHQVDRKTYKLVNEVLSNLGGKWSRSKKAHYFQNQNAKEVIRQALKDRSVLDLSKQEKLLGFFQTPKPIAAKMIHLAKLSKDHLILEPSAGQGRIIEAITNVGIDPDNIWACEILPKNQQFILGRWPNLKSHFWPNFLEPPIIRRNKKFARIIMNPPFNNKADIDHVSKAYNDHLVEGGILVAIMSSSVLTNGDSKTLTFRNKILKPNLIKQIELGLGAFKESGTLVNAIMIAIHKPITRVESRKNQ